MAPEQADRILDATARLIRAIASDRDVEDAEIALHHALTGWTGAPTAPPREDACPHCGVGPGVPCGRPIGYPCLHKS